MLVGAIVDGLEKPLSTLTCALLNNVVARLAVLGVLVGILARAALFGLNDGGINDADFAGL